MGQRAGLLQRPAPQYHPGHSPLRLGSQVARFTPGIWQSPPSLFCLCLLILPYHPAGPGTLAPTSAELLVSDLRPKGLLEFDYPREQLLASIHWSRPQIILKKTFDERLWPVSDILILPKFTSCPKNTETF